MGHEQDALEWEAVEGGQVGLAEAGGQHHQRGLVAVPTGGLEREHGLALHWVRLGHRQPFRRRQLGHHRGPVPHQRRRATAAVFLHPTGRQRLTPRKQHLERAAQLLQSTRVLLGDEAIVPLELALQCGAAQVAAADEAGAPSLTVGQQIGLGMKALTLGTVDPQVHPIAPF